MSVGSSAAVVDVTSSAVVLGALDVVEDTLSASSSDEPAADEGASGDEEEGECQAGGSTHGWHRSHRRSEVRR